MKVMEDHKHLLDIDQLLSRSWMCLLGLNNLLEYISLTSVDILDVLIMLNYRLDSKELQHGRVVNWTSDLLYLLSLSYIA